MKWDVAIKMDITVAVVPVFFTWSKWGLAVTWETLCTKCLGADNHPPYRTAAHYSTGSEVKDIATHLSSSEHTSHTQ